MAQPNHSSKRRRLDEAAATLSRPFKSPLRIAARNSPERNTFHANNNDEEEEEEEEEGEEDPVKAKAGNTCNLRQSEPPVLLPSKDPKRTLPQLPPDAELTSLQKQKTALQSRLSRLRSELDTAQQALRIESSPRDEELQSLIRKWRAVSQAAADELFVSAQERITRMGGVVAWRAREKENQRRSAWDDDGQDGEYSAAEGGADPQGKQSLDGSASSDKTQLERHDEDEVFTMDMMLKSLNVELDAIGFDKADQRWVNW